jgi:Ca2+-binding RTX toxin-like protein
MANILGTTGDDSLVGGKGESNTIDGLAGNDTLLGDRGNDLINGGAGNDQIVGGGGQDTLNGDTGDDTISGSFFSSDLNILVDGGDGNDLISGNGLNDTLNGGAGDDNIKGSNFGNTLINGGEGNDTLEQRSGRDTLNGGLGDDLFLGLASSAPMDGGDGVDTLDNFFYAGKDDITIDTGNFSSNSLPPLASNIKNIEVLNNVSVVSVVGNSKITDSVNRDDKIRFSGYGDTSITSNGGNDQIGFNYSPSNQTSDSGKNTKAIIDSGDGDDEIFFRVSTQFVSSNLSALVKGGNGNDRLNLTLPGQQRLDKTTYSVTLDGGDGIDTLDKVEITSESPVIVDLNAPPTTWNIPNLTIENIENIGGELRTGGGNDVITNSGVVGNKIYTRDGNDIIVGGAGVDYIEAGSNNDTVFGGAGIDTIVAESGDDFVYGGADNDSISGGSGRDNLEGNEGNDTINGEADDDGLAGQEGDDSLVGEDGNDRLYGWLGNDTLTGGAGNDTLYGGSEKDRLIGGSGADIFNFGSDFVTGDAFSSLGLDTIVDFQSGVDKIQLQRSVFAALPLALSFATVSDDGLAASSSEAIVYSLGTGTLFYNTDGAINGFGEGGAFTKLTGNPAIAASDFDLLPEN